LTRRAKQAAGFGVLPVVQKAHSARRLLDYLARERRHIAPKEERIARCRNLSARTSTRQNRKLHDDRPEIVASATNFNRVHSATCASKSIGLRQFGAFSDARTYPRDETPSILRPIAHLNCLLLAEQMVSSLKSKGKSALTAAIILLSTIFVAIGAADSAAAQTMTANAGTTPQSATVSTAFTNALAVTVKDAGNNPVSGVSVTFTAPGAGASGTFSNSTATITVITNASGVASAPITANATAGGPYTVTAASAGLTTVNFSLTNTAGTATQMTANAGTTPQSTAVSTAFTNALAVTVKDAGNNPVSGVNVTFTAPGAGASGTFSNATNTITVATNASGIASAPITANATAGGPYTVTAASAGLTTVNFSLTNTPAQQRR
jgi:hypothetical protein